MLDSESPSALLQPESSFFVILVCCSSSVPVQAGGGGGIVDIGELSPLPHSATAECCCFFSPFVVHKRGVGIIKCDEFVEIMGNPKDVRRSSLFAGPTLPLRLLLLPLVLLATSDLPPVVLGGIELGKEMRRLLLS